jgi:Tol biopolymer transport system component
MGYEVTGWFPVGWFPDGTKLVAQATSLGAEHSSAWLVSLLGGTPRKIRDGALAWSVAPDGSLIAYTTGGGEGYWESTFFSSDMWSTFYNSDIWVMGPSGEDPRKIVAASEGEFLFNVIWSPDSKRIAYKRFVSVPDGVRCEIESRDLKGGEPAVVLSDPKLAPRFGGGLWWLADQHLVYSFGDKVGGTSVTDTNLWEIRVDPRSGRPDGEPRQITNWSGFSLVGPNTTADAKRLVFGRLNAEADVYVGELERGGTRLRAPPRRLTLDERNDWPHGWTPDSKAILFQSDRSGKENIYKQALDQDSAEPLVSGPQTNRLARVSSDGAWIIYESSEPRDNGRMNGISAPGQLRRIPVSGGPSELVLTTHSWHDHQCSRAPATLCLLGEQSDDQKELIFTAFDPVRGRGPEVARIGTNSGHWYGWNLSPNGSEIAILYPAGENRIRLLPLGSGQPRDLVIKGWSGLNSGDWSADGKGLYVSSWSPVGVTLLYIDLKGHAIPMWEQRGGLWTWGVPSPDGRHLAIMALTLDSNVWMLENF